MKSNSPTLPSAVLVRFPTRRCFGQPDITIPKYYTKEVPISDAGLLIDVHTYIGHPGKKEFNETALALFQDAGGPPTNQTALDDLTIAVASDYYAWRTVSYDFTFNGTVFPDFDGGIDSIEWDLVEDDCTTRLRSEPYNGEPEELMHYDTANVNCSDPSDYSYITTKTPCIEFYGPPGKCVSGKPQLTRYRMCIRDGRLTQEFVSFDIIQ
jgi:hypothetical protein